MDVFEAMGTARAMRFFQPDAVPDDLVEKVLWAATRASSGNNTQGWDFVVIRDPAVRARLADALVPFAEAIESMPDPGNETDRRTLRGAKNLVTTLSEVPVIIVVCGANIYPPNQPREAFMYSAVYAAAQNLVVAARALGLGAAFTTVHLRAEPEFRDILGIPDDRYIGVTIPLGWPAGPVGPVNRKPLDEVVHHDHW